MRMIKLPSIEKCCGCGACYSACPNQAISMIPDEEGFLQPNINKDLCTSCGKCEQVCPVLHPGEPREPVAVYAAKAKDDELRRMSSSGGVFSLLARKILDEGGVVFGAAYEPPTFKVIHKGVFDEKGLDELRGSKYVQSEIGDTYKEAKEYLESGYKVLFSGCPCQIAGLKSFLGKDYDNLLLVDVICHAVPSPKVWQIFLEAQEKLVGERIKKVQPRRKCAWRSYEIEINFEDKNHKNFSRKFPIWYSIFFKELCCRNSCYQCLFRKFNSGSDISVGDFWGIEYVDSTIDDGKGVSVVVIKSKRGDEILTEVGKELWLKEVNIKQASRKNIAINKDEKISSRRQQFFNNLTVDNFNALSEKLTEHPAWFRFLRWLKRKIIGSKNI